MVQGACFANRIVPNGIRGWIGLLAGPGHHLLLAASLAADVPAQPRPTRNWLHTDGFQSTPSHKCCQNFRVA